MGIEDRVVFFPVIVNEGEPPTEIAARPLTHDEWTSILCEEAPLFGVAVEPYLDALTKLGTGKPSPALSDANDWQVVGGPILAVLRLVQAPIIAASIGFPGKGKEIAAWMDAPTQTFVLAVALSGIFGPHPFEAAGQIFAQGAFTLEHGKRVVRSLRSGGR